MARTALIVSAFLILMLTLSAPAARGQMLGDVTAAAGISGTLARQSSMSASGTLDGVRRSLASSSKRHDQGLGFGSSSGGGSRTARKSTPSRSSSHGSSKGGVGSWVTAGSSSRGSASSAWLQGGGGWSTSGGAASRGPGNPRRSRS